MKNVENIFGDQLIKCQICGKLMASSASVCPYCGDTDHTFLALDKQLIIEQDKEDADRYKQTVHTLVKANVICICIDFVLTLLIFAIK